MLEKRIRWVAWGMLFFAACMLCVIIILNKRIDKIAQQLQVQKSEVISKKEIK